MDTELDSTQTEQEATADPVQDTETDAVQADPSDVDYKARYAALKTDYDKIVKERKTAPAPKVSDDEVDWKIENAGRMKLVKDEYLKNLAELTEAGAKPTNAIREKALQLAEIEKGVSKSSSSSSEGERQAANSGPAASVQRSTSAPVNVTEHDRRFGITEKRKKELQEKYPDLLLEE